MSTRYRLPVHGHPGQLPDQGFPEAGEELVVVDRLRVPGRGGALAVVHEKEVDVGAEVELLAAVLAEGDDAEAGAPAAVVARYPPTFLQLPGRALEDGLENEVGQPGQLGADAGDVLETEDFGGPEAQQLPPLPPPQLLETGPARERLRSKSRLQPWRPSACGRGSE